MKKSPAFLLPRILGALALLGLAQPAAATVTLQFSADGVGQATGFSNTAAVAGIDGMRWGVVVDTSGNGFLPGQYDGDFDVNTSGFLKIAGVDTDDFYVAHSGAVLTQTTATTAGDPGGAGSVTMIGNVPFGGATNIATGNPFQIIWFESGTASNQKYGMLGNTSGTGTFTIPADLAVQSYADFFAGPTADPIKGTNLSLEGPDHGVLAIDLPAGSTINVAEDVVGSVVNIPIIRTAGADGPVGFTIIATGGVAVGQATIVTDFTAPVTPQSMADTVTTLNVPIPILNPPSTPEVNETFTVTISAATGGAALGAVTSVTVRIVDSVDTTIPTLTIGSPAANVVFNHATNDTVTISGTASDNRGVSAVKVKLNNGPYVNATLSAPGVSPTNWTISPVPFNGLNTISVQAFDTRNNPSAVMTRNITVLKQLVVDINDPTLGTLSAGTGFREVGKSYTLTATPKPPAGPFAGGIFKRWVLTGDDVVNNGDDFTPQRIGVAATALEKQSLTFIFREGLKLTAEFVVNPYPLMAGAYNGLIRPSSSKPDRLPTSPPGSPGLEDGTTRTNATEGKFTANVQNTGAFSATFIVDGYTLTATGSFDGDGNARFGTARLLTQTVARTGKPSLTVALQADKTTPGDHDKITGTVKATGFQQSIQTAESNVDSDRAYYNGTTLPVDPYFLGTLGATGTFTVILPAKTQDVQLGFTKKDFPQGFGTATFTIAKTGAITASGTLADNTAFSATSALSQDDTFAFFTQIYNKLGFVSGMVDVDKLPTDTDMSADDLMWLRPFQGTSNYYPYGWDVPIKVDLRGAKYVATAGQSILKAPGTPAITLEATNVDGNATLHYTDGALTDPLDKVVNITTGDVATRVPDNDPTFTLTTIDRMKGTFTGQFDHTDDNRINYNGIIYQKGVLAGGYGFFMTKQPTPIDYRGESGAVTLIGDPTVP